MGIYTTGVDVDGEKAEYIVREYYEIHEQTSNEIQQGNTLEEGRLADELPPVMNPILLRNKTNKTSERSKRCASVMVEATSSWKHGRKNQSRTSMYELRGHGWIFDKFDGNMMKTLNLDGEINAVL